MRAHFLPGIAAGIIFGSVTLTTPANAAAAYLSRSGSGSACTLAAPCISMNSAITAAGDGGEVICLDKGNYSAGTTFIQSSITISCGDGLWENPNLNILIQTPTGANVVIEGLVLDKLANSGSVISYSGRGALHLHRVRLGNDQTTSGFAINFQPQGPAKLFVTDSFIYNVGASGITGAINIQPSSGATADVVIERTRIENNRFGIVADGSFGGIIRGVVRDSIIAGNVNNGITVSTTSPSVVLSIDNCMISGNNFGLVASGSTAGMLVGRSVISGNNTGLSTGSGGVLLSYRDNRLNANTTDGVFTGPVGLQ